MVSAAAFIPWQEAAGARRAAAGVLGLAGLACRASPLRHNTKANCRSWRHPAPRTSERVRGAYPYALVIIMLLSCVRGQPPAGPLSNARLGRTPGFTQAPSQPHQPSFFFASFFVFILSNSANVGSIPEGREGNATGLDAERQRGRPMPARRHPTAG